MVFRPITGYKRNDMTKTSVKLTISSYSLDSINKVINATGFNAYYKNTLHKDAFEVSILLNSVDDCYTDPIILKVIDCLHKIIEYVPYQDIEKISIKVIIEIIVTDADETSVPGVLFSEEYILLASELKIPTRFNLMVTSSTTRGSLNSGVYLYIESENEINIPALNKLAKTQPSIIYRKGSMGKYTLLDFNAWGVEESSEKQTPDIPALTLMRKLQNAKEIGIFCKENDYESHVDITCYSIYSDPICFQLESSFFSFLKDLSVGYLSVDFMN